MLHTAKSFARSSLQKVYLNILYSMDKTSSNNINHALSGFAANNYNVRAKIVLIAKKENASCITRP